MAIEARERDLDGSCDRRRAEADGLGSSSASASLWPSGRAGSRVGCPRANGGARGPAIRPGDPNISRVLEARAFGNDAVASSDLYLSSYTDRIAQNRESMMAARCRCAAAYVPSDRRALFGEGSRALALVLARIKRRDRRQAALHDERDGVSKKGFGIAQHLLIARIRGSVPREKMASSCAVS